MLILSLMVDITTTFQRVPCLLVNWLLPKPTFLELENKQVWLTIVRVQTQLVKLAIRVKKLKDQAIQKRAYRVCCSNSMLFQVINVMLNQMAWFLTLLRFQVEHRVAWRFLTEITIISSHIQSFLPWKKRLHVWFLYLATVGSQHLWKIQANQQNIQLNQIILMTKTVTMEVRIPTMKTMTMMERSMTITTVKNMIIVLQLTVLLVKMSKGL